MSNLDATISEISFKLADSIKADKKKKSNLEKAFGVLASDGVYAFYVFCKSKEIWDKIENQLKPIKKYIFCDDSEMIDQKYFEKISGDLHTLLFVKEVLENILTYTRYHLKALEINNE